MKFTWMAPLRNVSVVLPKHCIFLVTSCSLTCLIGASLYNLDLGSPLFVLCLFSLVECTFVYSTTAPLQNSPSSTSSALLLPSFCMLFCLHSHMTSPMFPFPTAHFSFPFFHHTGLQIHCMEPSSHLGSVLLLPFFSGPNHQCHHCNSSSLQTSLPNCFPCRALLSLTAVDTLFLSLSVSFISTSCQQTCLPLFLFLCFVFYTVPTAPESKKVLDSLFLWYNSLRHCHFLKNK